MKKSIYIFLATVFVIVGCVLIRQIIHMRSVLPKIDPNVLTDRVVTIYKGNNGDIESYRINDNPQRKLVEISDIPSFLKYATLAIEDNNFYEDNKCNILLQFLFCRKSFCKYDPTLITTQIVKNVYYFETDNFRMEKFLFLPCKIENELSKDEILQVYFNEMRYSTTSYGIQAASKEFFNKNVKELNLAESSFLAVLPRSPLRYSFSGENMKEVIDRQYFILDLMVKDGYISAEKAQEAKDYNLIFSQSSSESANKE